MNEERQDWILGLLAVHPEAALDPIRIMKGVFLAQNETGEGEIEEVEVAPFAFQPYSYGPFTSSVYVTLEALEASGLVERVPVLGRSFQRWKLTERGVKSAESAVDAGRLSPDAQSRLQHAGSVIKSHTFDSLLRYTYERHPTYATRSVYRTAR